MNPLAVTSLASSFGQVVTNNHGASVPDPAEVMELFSRDGAVLLRGFPFDPDAFIAFSDRCCAGFSTYVGGGFRFRALDREGLGAGGTLMSTTGKTQSFAIALHGEMYYQKDRPEMLWFYCHQAPPARGQTTLADGRAIFAGLSERAKDLLRSRRLLYVRELSAEDWPTTFRTDDPEELRRICDANEMSLETREDGSIRVEFLSPAVVTGEDGTEVFINNAILLWQVEQAMRAGFAARILGENAPATPPLAIRLEDGSELPDWLVAEINEVSEPLTVDVNWQNGDVLLVDNRRILHGRRKTGEGVRDIQVRLGRLAV